MAETYKHPLTQAEFDDKLAANELVLCFIGMSGCGKSWSAKRMVSELGFRRYDCDGLIQEDLDEILIREGHLSEGVEPLEAMAAWMGQPPDERFEEREAEYLKLEQEKMEQIIHEIKSGKEHRNSVVDTTGSVVHIDPSIRDEVSDLATVVLFDVTFPMRKAMFAKYKEQPKPVVWNGNYQASPDQTPNEALEESYFRLLRRRSEVYLGMAQVVIPRQVKFGFANQAELLDYVRQELPQE